MARHHNGFIHRRRERLAPTGFDSHAFRFVLEYTRDHTPRQAVFSCLRILAIGSSSDLAQEELSSPISWATASSSARSAAARRIRRTFSRLCSWIVCRNGERCDHG